jgi:hypothetical protein
MAVHHAAHWFVGDGFRHLQFHQSVGQKVRDRRESAKARARQSGEKQGGRRRRRRRSKGGTTESSGSTTPTTEN